ncbi:NACHT, LRR and PYD domains-containing protein 7 [Hydra vulgaris]|uniref:NACHT, LRR and PYD domains-containing protein 7 n=1 Tax=Hydra vulgaris TaxID=6087 RepID=UPI001F5E40DE|nr:NACHT, LRR and PYD domains-containing protein 7-like [Hydra vulgaris]
MDTRVENILVNKVSSDWERFARCSEFGNDVSIYAVIEHVKSDEYTKDDKSKMKHFLKKLYQYNPKNWKISIENSLAHMDRNDILQDLSILDVPVMCSKLKKFYRSTYKIVNTLLPPSRVDVVNKFVELCIVNGVEVEADAVYYSKPEQFLKKQMNLTPIPFNEVFSEEFFLLLISGNAGIGKTWLLRKCLLDWSNGLIWKNIELVFYLECRRLNQYEHVSSINELLNIFYKDVINSLDINNCSVAFVIDGLDEFKYIDNLINPDNNINPPIVNALLGILKYKTVIAGRPSVILRCKNVIGERDAMLNIQVMGFNEDGISDYIENNVIAESKEKVKTVLKESPVAKSMAFVPFFLSCMCKILVETIQRDYMFLTETDLLASVFYYFIQKHINKNNEPVHKMMKSSQNKKYILSICEIAYSLYIENKVIFSPNEIAGFDILKDKLFGFIEKIETNLGCHYQFVHLAIMEFCASIHAYNNLTIEEIKQNQKLKNCFPMIFGLSNKNEKSLIKFLGNLNPNKEKKKKFLLFNMFANSVGPRGLFKKCFYESQATYADIKESTITIIIFFSVTIIEGQTSYETLCEKYLFKCLVESGVKLESLHIFKSSFTEDEKNTIIECSKNVRHVLIDDAFKIDGWEPTNKIEKLYIFVSKSNLMSKEVFQSFLPWFRVCDSLTLQFYDKVDFLNDIYNWIRCSNIKMVSIKYPGKEFQSLKELENYFKTLHFKSLICYTAVYIVFSFLTFVL